MKSLSVLVFYGIMFSGVAYASDYLSSCSSLIPNDHDYQVVITYDFEHGKKVKRFVGITDKNEKELSKSQIEAEKPFVDCIKNEIVNNFT
ncbi:hypothetical protein ACXR5E_000438 [Vibrio mimicus]